MLDSIGTNESKNLKILRYYGSSESNDFRIACGVTKKNEGHGGHQYVSKTLEPLGFTAGEFCSHITSSKIRNRKKTINEFKISEKRSATYETNISLNLDPNTSPKLKGKKIKTVQYFRMLTWMKLRLLFMVAKN